MKTPVSKDEFEKLLDEQLDFIEASARAFDDGYSGEIKRLAVSVRVLVHDTKMSMSLLQLTGKKGQKFVDLSDPVVEGNILSHSSLVQVRLSREGATPEPLLDGAPSRREIEFDDWWNGIVFVDQDKNKFSRKDIVLTLANKEGGAHVDTELDKQYADLRKNNSLGWVNITSDGKEIPAEDQVPATMRQIAHEILRTLRPNYKFEDVYANRGGVAILNPSIEAFSGSQPIPERNLSKNRQQIHRMKIGRNESCPCGSGRKYKKCCLNKD
jgi:hypothetical protein